MFNDFCCLAHFNHPKKRGMKIKSYPAVYVVFVHYDNERAVERCRSDVRKISESICFISVNTADETLSANYAYEFSGYHVGLLVALENLKTDFAKIIFLNDTVYSSHNRLFFDYTLDKFLTYDVDGQHLIGIKSSWTPGVLDSTVTYFPTFIFALQGSGSALSTFKFYENEFDSHAWRECLKNLPAAYTHSINAWLQPSSFLKGWYKASPYTLLPDSILRRKQYAIYQEHTLLVRAQSSGFTPFDLSEVDSFRRMLSILKFIDRLTSNLSKIIFRVINVLKVRYAK